MTQSPQRLTIWSNALLAPEGAGLLREELEHRHHLIISPQGADDMLKLAQVAFGQPEPAVLMESTKLKWLHLNSGGYTRYDTEEFSRAMRSRGVVVSNSSNVYSAPCAEHLLAMMLAMSRRLPEVLRRQRAGQFGKTPDLRVGCDILEGHTALIFGFGAIGRRFAELLAPFRMNLVGVRRHPGSEGPIRTVTPAQAEDLLPEADHIVNILPETSETIGFFNAERLRRTKAGAIFYNIGRGSTVDQSALTALLESKHLGGACLDVTTPEPLAPDDPLWRVPSCLITPHIGGVHALQYDRLVRHFLSNLAKFENGQPLVCVVEKLSAVASAKLSIK
jgi:phosphoglycerate dehydrogenase-like enzyme